MTLSASAEQTTPSDTAPALPSAKPAPQTRQPLQILIVDDHLASLTLLKEQVERLGHKPILARNGLEALFIWEDHPIDLIITDCNLPELDGLSLAEEVRRLERQLRMRPCTIIGTTASARNKDLQAALAAGMDACLLKPLSLSLLAHYVPTFIETDAQEPEEPVETVEDGSSALLLFNMPEAKRRELLSRLIIYNQQDLQALEDAMARLDLKMLGDLAHKLKSSAQMIQSERLLQLCEALERALEDNASTCTLRQLCQQLRVLMNQLNATLAAAVEPH